MAKARVGLAAVLFAAALVLFAAPGGAADRFSWRSCAGESLLVMLNKHPYAEMIVRKIEDFEALTGIKVAYLMVPEERYFPLLDDSFSATAGRPDVFMTGAYQIWEYAPRGHLVELDSFITNPLKTRANYSYRDFFPGISGAFRWDGKAGHRTGEGALWAIPIGFEANCLTYNREVLTNLRIQPPRSLEEMIELGDKLRDFEGEGTYALAIRGANDWNTLHSGYMTAFVNYGGKDVEVEDGRLVSRVNSPEAVKATDLWLRMIERAGPRNWREYDWYRASSDLGERKAAMMFDADILGYFTNAPGASPQSGRLASSLPLAPADADRNTLKSNLWVWGLAMNANSDIQDAAWLFIQYFTGAEFQRYSVLEGRSINPPRRSVFESVGFQEKAASMENFSAVFAAIIDDTSIHFTPNPHFFEIARKWVSTLHDIADKKYGSTQEGMDALKEWMDERLRDVPTE